MRILATILILCLLCPSIACASNDKLSHFIIGFSLSAVVGGERGLWAGVGAGLAKEGADALDRRRHSVELADAVATAVGAWVAYRAFPKAMKKPPTMKIELPDGSILK